MKTKSGIKTAGNQTKINYRGELQSSSSFFYLHKRAGKVLVPLSPARSFYFER